MLFREMMIKPPTIRHILLKVRELTYTRCSKIHENASCCQEN